ncbi:tRNA (adenine(22)-N(1))-methyltransferase [Salipaludibacillus sp. HK11]|uniref:tRNA (adenine(22)-N(1))-methyltransferase n=1 Tax=Salipaludibacillus sp. HK11 TaxID=3394320 RepID=UPI0039FD7F05
MIYYTDEIKVNEVNEQLLSKRLEKVSEFVAQGAILADIGSDHAYLPVHLVKQGKCPRAIAGEVNQGPLTSAKAQIAKHRLSDRITAKLGSGLSVLKDEKVDTVVVAGMGGSLIASILEEGKDYLEMVEQLILQPNVAADNVRRWLFKHGWSLVDEAIVDEEDHVYEIIVAEQGPPNLHYGSELEKELWMGPFLLKEKNSAFQKKWVRELDKLEKVFEQLNHASDQEKLVLKKQEIQQKLLWLKEVLP